MKNKILKMAFMIGVVVIIAGVVAVYNAQAHNILPPDKAQRLTALQNYMATTRAMSPQQRALTPTVTPVPTHVTGTPVAGIYQGGENAAGGLWDKTQFSSRSYWIGQVGSNWEVIYTGYVPNKDGSDQNVPGAVKIFSLASDESETLLGTFITTSNTGPLTIKSVTGSIFQLQADSGTTLTFNLQTHQFN